MHPEWRPISRPSLASLYIEMFANEQMLASATAFVVKHQTQLYLITNWHSLAGRNRLTGEALHSSKATPDQAKISFPLGGGRLGLRAEMTERLLDGDGNPLWLEHPIHRRQVDVVALPIARVVDQTEGYDPWAPVPPLPASVSDGVSIVGFPFGLQGAGGLAVWARGAVATEPIVDYEGLPAFLVDSRTRRGQSGSPVIAFNGPGSGVMSDGSIVTTRGSLEAFLGVYSGRVNDESDLGHVWKASAVREIVESGVQGNGAMSAD